MPIFHHHSLIFIHIPKTAGVSIEMQLGINQIKNNLPPEKSLFGYKNNLELDHLTMELIQNLPWIQYSSIQHYKKVAIVRNPYDRLVSEYHYKRSLGETRFVDASDIDFATFVRLIHKSFSEGKGYSQREVSHYLPQSNFIFSAEQKLLVDYVGRFENLEETCDEINRLTGSTNLSASASHYFKSEHAPFQTYYDKDTEKMVYQIYKQDFDNFSYDRLDFNS